MKNECPYCHTWFTTPNNPQDKKTTCPECNQVFIVTTAAIKILTLIIAALLIFDGIFGLIKFELYEKQETVTIWLPEHAGTSGVMKTTKIIDDNPEIGRRRLGAIPPIIFGLLIYFRSLYPSLTVSKLIYALIGGFLISAACGLPFASPYQLPESFVSLEGNVVLQLTRVVSFLLDISILQAGSSIGVRLIRLSPWLAMSIIFFAIVTIGIIFMKESFKIKKIV